MARVENIQGRIQRWSGYLTGTPATWSRSRGIGWQYRYTILSDGILTFSSSNGGADTSNSESHNLKSAIITGRNNDIAAF